MKTERWSNDDYTTRGVIDTLAKEILSKSPLLALDHVSQALERTITGSQYGSLAAVVVEECVDRLLQHPFFITDYHFGRIEINEFFQPIITVDDPAVEIV